MHELSLCNAIADTVTEHAQSRRINSVRLKIGHFRQVVPDTLQFCWSARTTDTMLSGCSLDIVHVEAVVVCRDCLGATTLDDPILRCGGCDSTAVDLVSGDEFLIESIDVGDAHASAAPSTGAS